MPVSLQYRRSGGSAARLTQTLLAGESWFDTDVDGWFIGDSATPGGIEVANAFKTVISVATQTINNSDAGRLFIYTNAAGCGVALAAPGGGGGTYFPASAGFWALNQSSGNVVFTATGATINGSATLNLFPGDSCVVVSDGTNYFALLSRTGISASTPINVHVVGNTTGATSSSTFSVTGSTISAAGAFSAGFSGGTLVFSNPPVNATENDTALGNTTANTSSTTQPLGHWAISGAGDMSLGFSASTLVFSGPSAPVVATNQNIAVLGNTTGATSSTVLTLTNLSVQGAGGISVGYSTTAAGAGVLVVSGLLPGGSQSSEGMTAIGGTAGTTSSQSATIVSQVVSAGGILSAGFSTGTFIVSGSIAGVSALSYFEPRLMVSGTSLMTGSGVGIIIVPLNLPAQLTFNRVRYLGSYSIVGAFGPNLAVATTTTSDTLTASATLVETNVVSNFTQVNSTQMSSVTSASVTTGLGVFASVSRSSNSVSASFSVTYSLLSDTGTMTTSGSSSSTRSSSNTMIFSFGTNTATTGFTGFFDWIVPLNTSIGSGYNAIGFRVANASGQTSQNSGVSWGVMSPNPLPAAFMYSSAIGNVVYRTAPGVVNLVGPNHPFGFGVTISNVTTYNPQSLSTTGAVYGALWFDMFLGS